MFLILIGYLLICCILFRGVILFGNESYGLEPAPQSTDNEHRLFHLKHSHPEPIVCGVTGEASHTESHSSFDPTLSMTALLRVSTLALYKQS